MANNKPKGTLVVIGFGKKPQPSPADLATPEARQRHAADIEAAFTGRPQPHGTFADDGKVSAQTAGYMELDGAQKSGECDLVEVPGGVSGERGTACTGGTANSVCFTPANAHSGAWTLQSATAGLQEAVNAAGAGGWVVDAEPISSIYTPLVLANTVRLTGFSAYDNSTGTQIVQLAANTDVIQVGTASATANDVDIEHLQAVGVSGSGSDSGVAIHCVNCVGLKLVDVIGKQAHDGVFFDSTNGHAYDGDVENSHFIGNYYGVHIVGGSANRLTFVGDTVDSNSYGVFDDGGWVHTWVGDDIESNADYGYWQQVSQPANYSGHNVDLIGNYFENNGSNTAGQGDVFLGQLVGGGATDNGAGCINCEVSGNLFNASTGGNVTALNLGSVSMTVEDNTYSGYGAGKVYATISGPNPNYSYVLALGDCGQVKGSGGNSACTQTAPGDITRLDANSALVLGGTDELTDIHGTMLADTTIESPTGIVRVRGVPGGAIASNPAQLDLDGDSTSIRSDQLFFNNAGAPEWSLKNDVAGANAHDFCLANDYANPSAATCDLYVNQQKRFKFSGVGVPGNVTLYGDYNFLQQANGDSGVVINRFTDTSPTGYLLDIEDSTNSNPLLRVDASGNLILSKGNLEGGSNTSAGWGNGEAIASSGDVMVLIGTLTTTAGGSDQIAGPGWLTSSSHCVATASNATAAGLTGVWVAPGASVVTVNHSATAGGTFVIACSQN